MSLMYISTNCIIIDEDQNDSISSSLGAPTPGVRSTLRTLNTF